MAEVVDKMPERVITVIFPWEEWLDGRVWKLTKGKDFVVTTATMANYTYTAARARNGRAVVKIREDDMYIQFSN